MYICDLSVGVFAPPGGSRGLAGDGGGGRRGASSPPVGEGQRRLSHHPLNATSHGASQSLAKLGKQMNAKG